MTASQWIAQFPGLRGLPADFKKKLISHNMIISLPAGAKVCGPGQAPQHYILMLKGTVMVRQISESCREIVLYRVSPGESCALTTACLMAYEDYVAEAVAETDVEAAAIPRARFDELIARSQCLRIARRQRSPANPAKFQARSYDAILAAIGTLLGAFASQECANYLQNCGYGAV